MDYLNPTFEKHLHALVNLVKVEFDIHLPTEKMIFDKSYREQVLSELSHRKSGVLSKHIKLLQNTQVYIKTTTQPFFLDELPDYSMPGKNDELVIPSVITKEPSSNRSLIIWFCGVCFVSLALLLVWLGNETFFVQSNNPLSDQKIANEPVSQEGIENNLHNINSDSMDSSLQLDEQKTVLASKAKEVKQKVVYAVQQSENPTILEAALHVDKANTVSNLNTDLAVKKVVQSEQKNEKVTSIETITPVQKTKSSITLFTRGNTEIYSPHVKRFVLAEGVQNREPIGVIDNIKFNNQVAKIYAFSQVTDLNNDTLYYSWHLDGKEQARVKVGIGSSYWRSYSTKRIAINAHGDWSVTLTNQDGDMLAVSYFSY